MKDFQLNLQEQNSLSKVSLSYENMSPRNNLASIEMTSKDDHDIPTVEMSSKNENQLQLEDFDTLNSPTEDTFLEVELNDDIIEPSGPNITNTTTNNASLEPNTLIASPNNVDTQNEQLITQIEKPNKGPGLVETLKLVFNDRETLGIYIFDLEFKF